MITKHVDNTSMSVAQLSARDDAMSVRIRSVSCQVDGEMSVEESVCTECGVQQLGCECEGSAAIGRELTNQNTEQTICRTIKYNTQSEGELISKLGRGARLPMSAVVKVLEEINIQHKNMSRKGRGARVTIPAIFEKKVSTPLKSKIIHRSGESNNENLTPVKRKLLQNFNTQTMLRVFKQYTNEPPEREGVEDTMKRNLHGVQKLPYYKFLEVVFMNI